ncbi:hypothetical protein B0J12DRAFT_764836 [Macrophomina phaseolina]|uniref:Prefoldin n=1 Tax=Macrophomina phaseolina TaxID=35725 RepID=A0ABQ8FZA4_9PEZI|nr:hypothetical protein B0J12DRAFT_764836 [Macrophomina phaseolina]
MRRSLTNTGLNRNTGGHLARVAQGRTNLRGEQSELMAQPIVHSRPKADDSELEQAAASNAIIMRNRERLACRTAYEEAEAIVQAGREAAEGKGRSLTKLRERCRTAGEDFIESLDSLRSDREQRLERESEKVRADLEEMTAAREGFQSMMEDLEAENAELSKRAHDLANENSQLEARLHATEPDEIWKSLRSHLKAEREEKEAYRRAAQDLEAERDRLQESRDAMKKFCEGLKRHNTRTVAAKDAEIAALKATHLPANIQLREELDAEIRACENLRRDNEIELKRLRAENDDYYDQIRELTQDKEDNMATIGAQSSQIQALESSLESSRQVASNTDSKVKGLAKALDEKNDDISVLNHEIWQLKLDITKRDGQLREKDIELNRLRPLEDEGEIRLFRTRASLIEALQNNNEWLNRDIANKDSTIKSQAVELSGLRENVEGKAASISQKDEAIATLENRISGQDETLADLRKEITAKTEIISENDQTISAQAAGLASLESKITEKSTAILERDQTISALSANISDQENTLASLRDEIATKSRTISEKEQVISSQSQNLTSLQEGLDDRSRTISEIEEAISTLLYTATEKDQDQLTARNFQTQISQRRAADDEVEHVTTALRQVENGRKAADEKVKGLQAGLEKEERQRQAANAQASQLERALQQEKDQREAADEKADALETRLREEQHQRETAKIEIHGLNRRVEDLCAHRRDFYIALFDALGEGPILDFSPEIPFLAWWPPDAGEVAAICKQIRDVRLTEQDQKRRIGELEAKAKDNLQDFRRDLASRSEAFVEQVHSTSTAVHIILCVITKTLETNSEFREIVQTFKKELDDERKLNKQHYDQLKSVLLEALGCFEPEHDTFLAEYLTIGIILSQGSGYISLDDQRLAEVIRD